MHYYNKWRINTVVTIADRHALYSFRNVNFNVTNWAKGGYPVEYLRVAFLTLSLLLLPLRSAPHFSLPPLSFLCALKVSQTRVLSSPSNTWGTTSDEIELDKLKSDEVQIFFHNKSIRESDSTIT